MKSDQVMFAEAVASLTARLEARGVEDALTIAQGFMADMTRHGWRPRALAVVPPLDGPDAPPPDLSDVRTKLKADVEAYQARVRTFHKSTGDTA